VGAQAGRREREAYEHASRAMLDASSQTVHDS
jgi:hypothetical protein